MSSPQSRYRAGLPLGTLYVILALIGWGLQYKTSLYLNIFQTSPDPPAKLLSDAERPTTRQSAPSFVLQRIQTEDKTSIALAAIHDGVPAADKGGFQRLSQAVISPPQRRPTRFFVRPPPLS